MPITVQPHASQIGIATASGGQAAQYRSASAFVTPGQENLGHGMRQLAAGMDTLGDAVFQVGHERRRMRNATDMLADQNAEKDAYRAFREDYEKNNQGKGAREAAQATEQYFRTRMEGLREKWGGNPHLMQAVDRMMAPIRADGLERAEAYSDQQEKIYMRAESDRAFGEAMLDFADPGKTTQALGASLGGYEASLRMLRGQRQDPETGQWVGGVPEAVDADLMQARHKLYSARADSLIDAERLGEARAFVHANARELGGRAGQFEARIQAAGKRLEAERLATVADDKAMSFVARLESGNEDESKIQLEILALPQKERGPTWSLFHQYSDVYRQTEQRQSEEALGGIIDEMRDGTPGEAFKRVEGLPEGTRLERRIKAGAKKVYSEMARHAGLTGTTDPDAYNALSDRLYAEDILSVEALRSDPLAVRVSRADLEKLEKGYLEEYKKREKAAFEEKALEFNPKLKQAEQSALFRKFEASVPDGGFKDPAQRTKLLNAFFKTEILLAKPGVIFDSEKSVPEFLSGDYARKGYYPKSGPEYQALKQQLVDQGIPVTNANLLKLYQQVKNVGDGL